VQANKKNHTKISFRHPDTSFAGRVRRVKKLFVCLFVYVTPSHLSLVGIMILKICKQYNQNRTLELNKYKLTTKLLNKLCKIINLVENIPLCEILIKEENFVLKQYSCITNKQN
jgi:hypothetical protein